MELSQDAISMLNSMAAALKGKKGQGGWVKDKATMVFSNPQKGAIWTIGKEDGTYGEAPSDQLRGYIQKLWFKEYDDDSFKWYLKLSAGDESFIIQSAHDRTFSRSMLGSIAIMTVEQVRGEVTIQCAGASNDKGQMHFCNIYVTGVGRLDPGKVDETNLREVAKQALTVVAQAHGA